MNTLDRLRTDWILATEINKLEARLWRQARRDHLNTILFTSAVRSEGKSTTVAYLATSMGLYPGRRVLAVDFDLRVPSLNSHFGIPIERGLDQVLSGEVSVDDAIIKTSLPSLHLLLPTPGKSNHHLLLHTEEMAALMSTLRGRYELILIDSPAIIPVADSTMLMPLADGVLLIGMAGKTTETQLRRAKEVCDGMGANILGLVIGNLQEAAPDYIAAEYDYFGYSDKDPKMRARKPPQNGKKK